MPRREWSIGSSRHFSGIRDSIPVDILPGVTILMIVLLITTLGAKPQVVTTAADLLLSVGHAPGSTMTARRSR